MSVCARNQSLPKLPPTAVRDLAAQTAMAFAEAKQQQVVRGQFYRFADSIVQTRVCGEHLTASVEPAFAHALEGESSTPDLIICAWAGEPAPPSPLQWYREHTDISVSNTNLPLFGEAFASDSVHIAMDVEPNCLHLLDFESNTAHFWIQRQQDIPVSWRASPFFRLLSPWFSSRGYVVAHASAVGTDAGGVLFVGPSGSGKSTTALSCIGDDLAFLSDDLSLIKCGPEPRIICLYNSAKLVHLSDLERSNALATYGNDLSIHHDQKFVFMLHALNAGLIQKHCALKAIVHPRLTNVARPVLRRVKAGRLLRGMFHDNFNLQPTLTVHVFSALSRIAATVPCYELEIGHETGEVREIVRSLIGG